MDGVSPAYQHVPLLLTRIGFTCDQVSLCNSNWRDVLVYFCLYPKRQDFRSKAANHTLCLLSDLSDYLEP